MQLGWWIHYDPHISKKNVLKKNVVCVRNEIQRTHHRGPSGQSKMRNVFGRIPLLKGEGAPRQRAG
jgi:hypothetical protein